MQSCSGNYMPIGAEYYRACSKSGGCGLPGCPARGFFDQVMDTADGAMDLLGTALGSEDSKTEVPGPKDKDSEVRKAKSRAKQVIDVDSGTPEKATPRYDTCPRCLGSKVLYGTNMEASVCPRCQGRGKVDMGKDDLTPVREPETTLPYGPPQNLGDIWKSDLKWAVVVDDNGSMTWHNFPSDSLEASCKEKWKSNQITNRVVLEHGKRITACTSCIISVTRR